MNWLQRLGIVAPAPDHDPGPPALLRQAQDERKVEAPLELPEVETTAHERALARAKRDVRRFGLAIEQCTKGEARLNVLRADLTRAERRLVMLEALGGEEI